MITYSKWSKRLVWHIERTTLGANGFPATMCGLIVTSGVHRDIRALKHKPARVCKSCERAQVAELSQ